ncbi:MAG: hypothetical protein Q7S19_03475 [bacterium]|nr:hypothetical protein [bacterium]
MQKEKGEIMNRRRVWIRIAGNGKNIAEGSGLHWRCYINDIDLEEPIDRWNIVGDATSENFIPRTNPKRDKNGLTAWIDIYGDIVIDKDRVAQIHLRAL